MESSSCASRSIPSSVAVPVDRSRDRRGSPSLGARDPRTSPTGMSPYYVFERPRTSGVGSWIRSEPTLPVRIADEGTWVHPPLGKWIIALLGVGPIGQRPIGWRLPSALFGIAGVGSCTSSPSASGDRLVGGPSCPAAGVDGLHIVQSRMAMLDIFLTTSSRRRVVPRPGSRTDGVTPSAARWPGRPAVRLPYRLWAGVFLGCAIATKWSGAFALAFVAGLCAIWAFTRGPAGHRSALATL